MQIQLKRAYESPTSSDGLRVLVERMWPRGVQRDAAHIDLWLKDIAPSTPLRKWYHHDVKRWSDFRRGYRKELDHNDDALRKLRTALDHQQKVTLVFATQDVEHSSAVVLRDYLAERF